MNFLELYWTDVYKTGHKPMLPTGSTLMYSNNTPRSGKYSNCPNDGKIVVFGQQMMVRKLKKDWDDNFFNRPIEEIDQFGNDLTTMLGLSKPYDISHLQDLHKLGYLPIRIKAMEEGSVVPYKIPSFTIVNTKPLNGVVVDWLVNYLETILSAESWQAPTSATFIHSLRALGKKWLLTTAPEAIDFLDYQFHDFSMRGMGGKSAIVNSGLGFITGSRGSDTLPVIPAARMYYDEKEPCINSVIASEHAIMCSLTGFFMRNAEGDWTKVAEFEYEMFVYLLQKFPTGILSLVMDTFDLWRAITEYCVKAKDLILARGEYKVLQKNLSLRTNEILVPYLIDDVVYYKTTIIDNDVDTLENVHICQDEIEYQIRHGLIQHTPGKLVIRPDSGDPVDILCGRNVININNTYFTESNIIDDNGNPILNFANISHNEYKGVIELFWDIFGGTISSTGYKILDPHIGAIYGDSINYIRSEQIFTRLAAKDFASCNVVLGVGSYSLQMVTRDTHGSAQKATYIEIERQLPHGGDFGGNKPKFEVVGIEIFKDPITDDGVKKSAKGLLKVTHDGNDFVLQDQCTWEEESQGLLQVIFEDGDFFNQTTLTAIRERLNK